MIGSFDILYITLAFLVPGFIIDFCLKRFIPQRETSDSNRNILYYLCWSSINYGLWSWLIYLMFKSGYFIDHPIRTAAAGAVIIFVSPILVSVIVLISYKLGFLKLVSWIFKLNPKHPTPTAWDYKWNDIANNISNGKEDKKWVIVVLDDGSNIGGIWGENSFASSIEGERDLYLEKVYKISPNNGTWEAVPRNDGIWIKGTAIKSIQFMNDEIKENKANG